MIDAYYMLIRITPEEMWQLKNENPGLEGVPVYYCMMGKDKMQLHPTPATQQFSLMIKGEL